MARIGGDEFASIRSGTGEAAAGHVLQEVIAADAAPVRFEDKELPVSVSVGACAYPRGAGRALQLRLLQRRSAVVSPSLAFLRPCIKERGS